MNSQNPAFVKKISVHDTRTGLTRTFDLNVLQVNKSDLQCHLPKPATDKLQNNALKNLERGKAMELSCSNPSVSNVKIIEEKTDSSKKHTEIDSIGNVHEIRKRTSPSPSAWTKEEISTLIALLEPETCLYDKKDPDIHNHQKQRIAYERIQQVMACIQSFYSVIEVRNEIKYLQLKYVKEKCRKEVCIRSGLYTDDTFKSKLWYFNQLNFLDDHALPHSERKFVKTVKVNEIEEETREELNSEESERHELFTGNDEHFEKNEDAINLESDKEEQFENSVDKDDEPEYEISEDVINVESDKEEEFENSVDKEPPPEYEKSVGECTNKRKENFSCPPSKKVNVNKKSVRSSRDREFIFGRYVANEMKIIKNSPLLYIKTKQAILKILTNANIQIVKSDS